MVEMLEVGMMESGHPLSAPLKQRLWLHQVDYTHMYVAVMFWTARELEADDIAVTRAFLLPPFGVFADSV
jgi:hypothetical protein